MQKVKVECAIAALGLLCAPLATVSAAGEDSLLTLARQLAEECIIVDTHIDAPYRFASGKEDVTRRTEKGDFDVVRSMEGGLDVPFMSIYTPSSLEGTGRAKAKAEELIDGVYALARRAPDRFVVVTSVADIRRFAGKGRILLAMGMENGSPIEEKLSNLRHFYSRGIRYCTLAHARWNHLADASYDTVRHWNGLSPFGRKVVAEMNRLGMMIDVSHLTDSAAMQAIRLSRAPVIASHSACREFTPGFERNASDELIRAIAGAGGVVQINFGSEFLDDGYRLQEARERAEIKEHFAGVTPRPDDSTIERYADAYRAEHPRKALGVGRVADHIDHVVAIAGIDAVGFGSDFDGVGDTLPVGLKSVADYPNLIAELLQRGYSRDAIKKICGENLLRTWRKVEKVAYGLKGKK